MYKRLIKFIHQLACINKDGLCDHCPLSHQCQYYHLTGENFKYYPGLFIKNSMFVKSLYRENEELVIQFYLLGNCENYGAYIELFFQEYLNHRFVGFDFQIKLFERETINCQMITRNTISLTSLVEEGNIKDVYNTMMDYYNDHYGTSFEGVINDNFEKGIPSSYKPVSLGTKRIVPKGVLYKEIAIPEPWNDLILNIGLGKFNYIGGGKIET